MEFQSVFSTVFWRNSPEDALAYTAGDGLVLAARAERINPFQHEA